jgi:hypothetical protein
MILIDFWKVGIRNNSGLPFHILGGKLIQYLAIGHGESYADALAIVLVAAIVFELFELAGMVFGVGGLELGLITKRYGTLKNFVLDSIGDILGALAGAI